MKIVLKGFLHILKDQFSDLDNLRWKLTVRSVFNREYYVRPYKEGRKSIGIPMFFRPSLLEKATEIVDLRTVGQPVAIQLQTTLWEYQQDFFNKICESMEKQNSTNFIIEARTGWGKTVLASALISYLDTTTLIVVPVSTLVFQWKEELLLHTSLTEDDIGIAMDAKVDWRGKKVVIGLVHTLVLDRWGEDFKEHFGFVLLDEVDKSAPPETFSPICTMFPAKYRIAMSATPDRKDGLSKVVKWHFGQVFMNGNMYADIKVKKAKVLSVYYSNGSPPDKLQYIRDSLSRRGVVLSALAESDDRNKVLCQYTKTFYNTKRATLILSDRIQQLLYLARIMETSYKVPVREMGFFVRSLPKTALYRKTPQERLPEKLLIFATYKMLDIGFDMKPLAGLILATPRSSITQTVGRVERFLEGKQQPIVLDLKDEAYPDAVKWSLAREKEYRTLGIPVTVRRHT